MISTKPAIQTTWTGHFLDGRHASRHSVAIQPRRDALHLRIADGRTLIWPYAHIRQAQGFYAGEHVRLELGEDSTEAVVVADHGFLIALHGLAPDLTSHLHDPSRRHARIRLTVVAAVSAIGIVAVLYLWGIPGLARILTPYVPVSWEQRLGRAAVESLAPEKMRCTDPSRYQAILDITAMLTSTLPNTPYQFQVFVVDIPIVNAFAAPGGYIVVLRGLLEKTQSPEQLAGVLAHEIQHIVKRHTTRALIEHTSTGLLLAAVSGDFTGAMTYGVEAARSLGMLRYSRAHEEEADREGMRMLLAAGINPAGMIEFFDIMNRQAPAMPGLLEYISSHPSEENRIAYLQQLAGQTQPAQIKLLPQIDWREIKSICAVSKRPSKHPLSQSPQQSN